MVRDLENTIARFQFANGILVHCHGKKDFAKKRPEIDCLQILTSFFFPANENVRKQTQRSIGVLCHASSRALWMLKQISIGQISQISMKPPASYLAFLTYACLCPCN